MTTKQQNINDNNHGDQKGLQTTLKTILGVIVVVLTFTRFFQNSIISAYDFFELFIGISLFIYLFNGFSKNPSFANKQFNSDAIIVDTNNNDNKQSTKNVDPDFVFISPTNFSGGSRVFATFVDYLILFPLFGYLYDVLERYTTGMVALAIAYIVVFAVMYSFLQYKKWVSINFILKKKIVKKDGTNLSYRDFVERNIKKSFVMLAYSFLITFILFPPIKYFYEGLTPVDKFCDTKEAE